ncbi:MAG: EAL domain-containing protein [Azospirillaceae bacterium]|nr:EAL domain-containing protein [Azospirillaceae bacterium]
MLKDAATGSPKASALDDRDSHATQAVAPPVPRSPAADHAILDHHPPVACIIDVEADGKIVSFSSAAEALFGFRRAEILGRPVSDLIGSPPAVHHNGPLMARYFASPRRHGHLHQSEILAFHALNRVFPAEIVIAERCLEGRDLFSVSVRDLTERRAYEQRLQELAYQDPQTGLPNRAALLEQMKRLLAGQQPIVLLVIDIDRYRMLKNSLGHDIGHRILIAFIERIRKILAPRDFLARLYSDDFGLVIEQVGSQDATIAAAATRRVEAITEALQQPFPIDGRELRLGVSIGITQADPDAMPKANPDGESLLRDAEIAAYQVRRAGGAAHGWFNSAMRARLVEVQETEHDLRRALDHDTDAPRALAPEAGLLWNAYQPIVDLSSGHLVGFEALMRWTHPRRGTIPPGIAIPIAEETGLIDAVGGSVLRRACTQLMAWTRCYPAAAELFVAVNLSPRQLANPQLAEDIATLLGDTGLPGSRLKLEITESALMTNPDAALEMLHRLKALGVRLSLDDFGTGYSAFSYLHQLPVDSLKIDRSFVDAMSNRSGNREIIRVIADLGRALGLGVIVEGIETTHELAALDGLGCHCGQGYLLAHPLPAEQVTALFKGPAPWAPLFGPQPA